MARQAPIMVVNHRLGVCRVDPEGKSCRTVFEMMRRDSGTSVVRARPQTGRMHQIRVHLQHLGVALPRPRLRVLHALIGGFMRIQAFPSPTIRYTTCQRW